MTPVEINAKLAEVGTTQRGVATALKVSTSAVSSVIHGRSTSARIQNAVATIVGKTPKEIWGNDRKPRGEAAAQRAKALLSGMRRAA
jgi:lambda repressor-like predicted transcriptional regulator